MKFSTLGLSLCALSQVYFRMGLFSPVLKANILLGANKMAGQISLLVRHDIIFLLIIYFIKKIIVLAIGTQITKTCNFWGFI